MTEVVTGDGDAYLLDPTDGLAGLASYHATLVLTFAGTRSAVPASWTMTSTYDVIHEPFADLLTVDQPVDLPAIFPAWSATADGASYILADGQCLGALPEPAEAADPATSAPGPLARDPAAQLPGFIGAEVTDTDTVNGVAVDVATLGPASLGLAPGVAASGTVKLATSGDYVVSYDLVREGGPELFGEGTSGKLTSHYELSSIGTATVAVPAGCPAGLIEGPQPVDAANVEALPGFLSLTTGGSVVDTAALYRDTSLAFGWHAAGDATINQDLGALTFTADGLSIRVAITAIDGGSRVEVVATRT